MPFLFLPSPNLGAPSCPPDPPSPHDCRGPRSKVGGLEKGHRLVPRIPFLKEMVQAGVLQRAGEAEKEPCLGGHSKVG